MHPIWKDLDITLGSAVSNGLTFQVYDSELYTIYTGKAYPRPNASFIITRINDVVAPLLTRGLTFLGETDSPVRIISVYVNGSAVSVTQEIWADWSYDGAFSPENDGLNFPICDILLPGQYVPHTAVADDYYLFTLQVVGASAGSYNADFNEDFAITGDVEEEVEVANDGRFQTAWLDLSDYPTATQVEVGGHTYRVGGGCGQFALYYVNAYGGWDTLAVLGKTKTTDAVAHHTTEKVYNNGQTYHRGKVNYVNELTRRFTFYTHWLTEEQSARMHHLLNSPTVYLHDVVKGKVYPIVLTGSVTEHKNNRLNQYAIEAELAQDRIRR